MVKEKNKKTTPTQEKKSKGKSPTTKKTVVKKSKGKKKTGIKTYSDGIAEIIKKDPSQWLWLHNRWKVD